MRHFSNKLSRTPLSRAALLAVLAGVAATPLHAADVTWTNATSSGYWDAGFANWSNGAWINGAGNAAIFGATGAGYVSVLQPVNVRSLDFKANGYTVGGAALNLVANGSGTLGAGWISTSPGATAHIDSAINVGTAGLVKKGGGTLELAGPLTFSGAGIPFIINGPNKLLVNDLYIAGYSQVELGGTVKIMNSSVLPSTTRVGIGNGILDLGANDVTLASVNFINQADAGTWDPVRKVGSTGIIGTGTLRVTGDITIRGSCCGTDGANTISTNLDIGSGTQIIRSSHNTSVMQFRALQLAGSISGSGNLLKTSGINENGVLGQPDGIGLYGNNTYTGATILNGGASLVTGTNASSLLKVSGGFTSGSASSVTLAGANGSYLAADTLQAFNTSAIIIDNSFALPAGGDYPTIAAANNGNRLKDTAELQLRNGTFSYTSGSGQTSSETFGKLSAMGGHNIVSLTAKGVGGAVTLTASGGLEMDPRATLQIASTTLGAASKLFVNGAMPAADSTGIVPRIVGSSDFLRYDAVTGFTPLTAGNYATFAAGAGANVLTAASSTVAASVNINALKSTGSNTTTIAAGQTLGIASGMILNASGTATINGGTLAFANAAGTFLGGVTNVASAITGTNGLINSSTQLTLTGDLSGLSGPITTNTSLILATNTFGGAIDLRTGTLAINTSQTKPGQGAITLGVNTNDANLLGSAIAVTTSGAGKDAVIGRDFISDNGSQSAAGMELWYTLMPQINPLSNTTGSQTFSGNFLLNSPMRIQGGGAANGSTGSSNFTGNFSGPARFYVSNGRANFSGNLANEGGFRIGEGGFTAQVTFSGTTTGSAPITLMGGNNTTMSYQPGSLPTGPLTVYGGYGATAPTIISLATSTINNAIIGSAADIKVSTAAGVTATFAGAVTSGVDGYLIKQGAGTLVLTNAGNSVGSTQVNGGTLLVNGALGGLGVAVNTGGTLGGTGSIAGEILVNTGGSVAADGLSADKLTLTGNLLADVDLSGGSTDWLKIASGVSLGAASALQLGLSSLPAGDFSGTYLLLSQGGANAISGSFGSILGLPAGYTMSIDYAFNGVDSLGRAGDGNDLALRISAVPEPGTMLLMALGVGGLLMHRRRRAA